MADQAEGQPQTLHEATDQAQERTFDDSLEYPQIPLNASFDSLLRNSYPSEPRSSTPTMTRSNRPVRQPDLSESWASLSDADLSQNEELLSERTDTESIVDLSNTDDIISLQGEDQTDAATEDEGDEGDELGPAPTTSAQNPDGLDEDALADADLLPMHITLEEPSTPAHSENVHVRHTLKLIGPEEASALSSEGTTGDLVGAIDLTLNKLSLRDSGRQSLRILLLGKESRPGVRDDIKNKLGDALIASGRPFGNSQSSSVSRYHVVPGSFGPGSMHSTAELIPMQQGFEVEEYHSIELNSEDQYILLGDGTNQKPCSDIRSASPRYDLAIIISATPEPDHSAQCFLDLTYDVTIPSLLITVDNTWNSPSHFAPPAGVAHRVVVSRPVWQSKVLGCLPLDLETFLNLNAGQLSRHLSWLIEHTTQSSTTDLARSTSVQFSIASDTVCQVATLIRSNLSDILLFLVIISTIHASWSIWSTWSQASVSRAGARQVGTNSTNFPTIDTTPFACVSSDTTTKSIPSATTKSIASTSALPSVPLAIDAAKSTYGKFEVEVIGSSHLVVRIPHYKKKGKTSLDITVSRAGTPIDTEFKKLFPGVYSVHIPSEQMYGEISVQLEMRNPRLSDIISLQLGPEPLDAWLRRALNDLGSSASTQLIAAQDIVLGITHPDFRQKYVEQAKQALEEGSEKLEKIFKFEQRVQQPLRKLDSRRVALNKYIDEKGEAKIEKVTRWLAKQKVRAELINSKATESVQKKIAHYESRLEKLKAASLDTGASALRNIETGMRKGKQVPKQTLARAQDRVHQLLGQWQAKKQSPPKAKHSVGKGKGGGCRHARVRR